MVIKPKERKETIEFVCYTFLFIFVALSVHKTQLSRVASNYEIYHCVWPKEHLPNKYWHLFFATVMFAGFHFNFALWSESRDATVVNVLASQQCGGYDSLTLGWVFFLLLYSASRGFLRVLRFSRLLKNRHFQIPIRSWNTRTFLNVFLWTL